MENRRPPAGPMRSVADLLPDLRQFCAEMAAQARARAVNQSAALPVPAAELPDLNPPANRRHPDETPEMAALRQSLIEKLIIHGGRGPTSTAHMARLRIFQPTRRPERKTEILESAWGKVAVTGKLGQMHFDVLEAILRCGRLHAADTRRGVDGGVLLVVDPAEVRRVARQESTETFHQVVRELMDAFVDIKKPSHLRSWGHLINDVNMKFQPIDGPGGVVVERQLWGVHLGQALCRLLNDDIWLYHDPQPVAAMRHGISQAVTRLVLSHQVTPPAGWMLDGLIAAVAGEQDTESLRNRRRELAQDAGNLDRAGVVLTTDDKSRRRVRRKKD